MTVSSYRDIFVPFVLAKREIKLKKEHEEMQKQLDKTIDGLHKEITTSENAFEGLMNENKELRQKQQEMGVLLIKIEREFRERGILTEEEFMRLLE